MEKRHENSLMGMLEKVAFEGFASKPKWQIARYYKQSNFTLNIRRDIRDRWKNLVTDELGWKQTPVLKMADVGGEIIFMKGGDFFPDKE